MTRCAAVRVGCRSVVVLTLALHFGCAKPPPSPEEQVRAVIVSIEKAMREKDLAALKAIISDRYADADGRDKNAIKGLAAYYFLEQKSIHVLTQIRSLTFPEPAKAEVSIVAAMAGTHIRDLSWLPKMQADLYRFEVEFTREDAVAWRVTRAAWQPATMDDFAEGGAQKGDR